VKVIPMARYHEKGWQTREAVVVANYFLAFSFLCCLIAGATNQPNADPKIVTNKQVLS
jgi:hypothetical protein